MNENARKHGRLREGYTLLELIAVMAIILVAGAAVVRGIQSIRKASLTTSASTLAAAVRYLYDLAVLNNRPYKLVISLDEGTFAGQEADSTDGCPTALLPSSDDALSQREPQEGQGGKREGDEEGEGVSVKPRGHGLKDNLLKKRKLPKRISFAGVVTTHNDDVVTDGTAEVYFFPSGYVEKALVYLKRGDDVYTVETIPLRGTAVITPEKVDYRVVMQ